MKASRFAESVLVLMVILAILAIPAYAIEGELNLPSDIIIMQVTNGTQSYFDTTLTGIPDGYDVPNGTYLGWCVDSRTNMTRSPATHEVRLFSSTNPPVELADQRWDMANYILNHKRGAIADVQQALWYFITFVGNYTPTRSVAWEIVNDTLQNGEGYIPVVGESMAVICYPLIYSHEPDVQVSIIEVESHNVVPEFPSALMLTPVMVTTIAVVAYARKRKHVR